MLRKLIGLNEEGSILSLEWFFRNPLPTAILVALVGLAVGYAVFMYKREKTLSLPKRGVLAVLRAAVYSVVLLMLFEPVLAYDMDVKVRKTLLVLVDESASMGIKDARKSDGELLDAALASGRLAYGSDLSTVSHSDRQSLAEISRHELAKSILEHPQLDIFRQLSANYQIRYFGFGDGLTPSEGKGQALPDSIRNALPDDKITRLASALTQAKLNYGGQSISGIVVISDGASNEPSDPIKAAMDLKVPIYTVGVGLPSPADVRVKSLVCPDVVFVKDTVPLRVQITSNGLNNQTATMVLRFNGSEVGRKNVVLANGSQFYEMTFTPTAKADAAALEIAILPVSNEANPSNNVQAKTVKVTDTKIRVLYVEGKPRWEFRYLRRVLLRDHRLDVKFLMTEGDKELAKDSEQYVAEFPEEEFRKFPFDLVILGDVPATYFSKTQMDRMEEIVSKWGCSLIMLAGPKNAPSTYVNTPIETMLPVTFRREAWQAVSDDAHPQITRDGYASAMMSLDANEAANQQLWDVVKPLYEAPSNLAAKGGATVLAGLTGKKDYPLVAWQRYGSGKTLFVGTDQLWRIRLKVGDKHHARFWSQAIQFLTLSKILGENKRFQFQIDKTDYQAGERVQVNLNALNEAYGPLLTEDYAIRLESSAAPGQFQEEHLKPVAGAPGLYQGTFVAAKAGAFKVLASQKDQSDANSVVFNVKESDIELVEPAMQEETLRQMAELSGGRYFTAQQLPEMMQAIMGPQHSTIARREQSLWDLPIVLGVLLCLLGGEWFLRRKYDLL